MCGAVPKTTRSAGRSEVALMVCSTTARSLAFTSGRSRSGTRPVVSTWPYRYGELLYESSASGLAHCDATWPVICSGGSGGPSCALYTPLMSNADRG